MLFGGLPKAGRFSPTLIETVYREETHTKKVSLQEFFDKYMPEKALTEVDEQEEKRRE